MSNESPIKDVLAKFVHRRSIKDRYQLVEIKEAWKREMGPMIQKYTSDIRFFDGALTVVISSAPLRHELSFGQDKIRQVLNDSLGQDLIKQVKIF